MSGETSDLLVDVRRAYRLVHAYQRRLLDALRPAVVAVKEAYPELRHLGSKPNRYARPMLKQDPTDRKWAWDYLPLAFADLTWATSKRPEDGAVYFIVRHMVDTGFRMEHGREPDPVGFEAADECETLIELALACVVGTPSQHTWNALHEAAADKTPHEGWAESFAHEVVLGAASVRFGVLGLDVATLESMEAVQRLLVAPVANLARALKER